MLMAGCPAAADAGIVRVETIAAVMTGSSSSGADQVWLGVSGELPGVPSSCMTGGRSLFYVPDGDGLDGAKAMAALLSAKMTATPVTLAYTVMGSSSDFWGFGITNCRIDRMSMGS
jgi:hypothetical protein